MQALSIPGFQGRNSICNVRTPQSLPPINFIAFAQGSALGGNNTCFTGYKELREVLTATFGNAEGSYLVKINKTFDTYCELSGNHQGRKKSKEIKPNDSNDKQELDWSSSTFVDYLCFLLSYFVPRKAFGIAKTTSAQAFGREVSRDKLIEYLLPLCTGVIFSRKTVSSHCQNVRISFGQRRTDIPPSAVLLSMQHGFEGDFPGESNPMGVDVEWMHNFYTLG
ncbi:hypothetical protein QFC20_006173 [Naganishia adeliensis]|uniref:Uncharacterized protein n=1 Tax=Naganishia adeliensis TaxID=92952 RepID=A0ACC2VFA5_9TREE|nr:hypothetical protein QFC20_006173 [Naganishia adeliensis]